MSKYNILGVYSLASTVDKSEGVSWYRRANDVATSLARTYDVPLPTVVGVIAALSPRNRWERNIADAERLIKVFCADPAAASSVKVCTFNHNKAKAIRLLEKKVQHFQDVLSVLNGPKLQEFANCIVGIPNVVVIDGHAYSIWMGERIGLQDVPKIGVKLRKQITADYVAAAEDLNIPAYQLQAITWCTWRRIHGVD
jgi:hypothetical protein